MNPFDIFFSKQWTAEYNSKREGGLPNLKWRREGFSAEAKHPVSFACKHPQRREVFHMK